METMMNEEVVGRVFEMYFLAKALFDEVYEEYFKTTSQEGMYDFGLFMFKVYNKCQSNFELKELRIKYGRYDSNFRTILLMLYRDENSMSSLINEVISELELNSKATRNLALEFIEAKQKKAEEAERILEDRKQKKADMIREDITDKRVISIIENEIASRGWATLGGFGCCCTGGACSDMKGYEDLLADIVEDWKEKGVLLRITNIDGLEFTAFDFQRNRYLANVPSGLWKYPAAKELIERNK